MTPLALLLPLVAAPPAAPDVAALLPQLAGWEREVPETYGPKDLFEAINGAAEAFLQQDFEELTTVEYEGAAGKVITVEVYRHRDAWCAFAMYSQERSQSAAPLRLGVEGVGGKGHLELVVGSYYVKLAQSGGVDESALWTVAETLAAALPGAREPPPVLAAFPARGKVARAEKLTARAVLGHAFLHRGAAAAYELAGARFRLFAIEGRDAADLQQMLGRYLALAQSEAKPTAEGAATVKDPLNGVVELSWKGRWLWGAVDSPLPQRSALVRELGDNLAGLLPEVVPRR
jgi:hypothetical protein